MNSSANSLKNDPKSTVRQRARGGSLLPLLLRLHFYAGIFVGPLILLAAITGGFYAATPFLERLVYSQELYSSSDEMAVPVGEQVQSAVDLHPDLDLASVKLKEPGENTWISFREAGQQGPSATVFVDPATGEIRGEQMMAFSAFPLRAWVSTFHKSLNLGKGSETEFNLAGTTFTLDPIGVLYSEAAAGWLAIVVLAGGILFLHRALKSRQPILVSLFVPDRKARGRARSRSLHGVAGMWLMVGALMLAATGLSWSQMTGNYLKQARVAMDWQAPRVDASARSEGIAISAGGETAESVELISELSRAAGLTLPITINAPRQPGANWTASEAMGWPHLGSDSIAVDTGTGVIVDRVDFSQWGIVAKLVSWGVLLHMGLLFGAVNQLALIALAGGLIFVVCKGYHLWWLRRPTRQGKFSLGRPIARGTWRQVPRWQLVCVGLVAIAVAWFSPVVGASALIFLAVDAVIGMRSRNNKAVEREEVDV